MNVINQFTYDDRNYIRALIHWHEHVGTSTQSPDLHSPVVGWRHDENILAQILPVTKQASLCHTHLYASFAYGGPTNTYRTPWNPHPG